MASLATIAPFGFDLVTPRFLAAFKALGCDACQFYRNPENPPTPADAVRIAAEAGLSFDSIHGLFGYDYDPSSPDPAERARCLDVYRAEADLCRDLGGSMVVVHPACWTPERRLLSRAEADAAQQQRWAFLDDFLRRLAPVGESHGVTFLIENQPFNTYLGHDPVQLARHVVAAASPRIRMCLDLGHAHITAGTAGLVEVIEACAAAVAYLHVHDNDAALDQHFMPGQGAIEWKAVSGALRRTIPRATRMLEVFSEPEEVEALARAGLAERLRGALAL